MTCDLCEAARITPWHAEDDVCWVADERFGPDGWSLDRVMRQIPDHFHAHARDPHWWSRLVARR